MGASQRESKGEQTRRSIVSRALRIVSDVGYEGLSIGALAEESKLSKSGLFCAFQVKGGFAARRNRGSGSPLHPARSAAALASPRGEPGCVCCSRRNWNGFVVSRNPRMLAAEGLARVSHRFGHPVRERAVHAPQDWRELLTRCAQTAIDEGHFRTDLDAESLDTSSMGLR